MTDAPASTVIQTTIDAPKLMPLGEAVPTWARIAALSFGGPAGQIAVMHRILVEEKRWIGEDRFLHALNYCMLLPGPEAHQLAVYIGWLMHRTWGGVVAGLLFVLPGLLALGILSWLYAAFGQIGVVGALFFGMKAAVLAIVAEAVVRIGRRALKRRVYVALAAMAFVGIFFLGIAFPVIVLAAGVIGFAGYRISPGLFSPQKGHGADEAAPKVGLVDALFAKGEPEHVRPSATRLLRVTLVGGFIWLAPLLACFLALGPANVFTLIAAFNSKMAVVTFGGAYAVLAYMAQQAVEHYHWLQPGEMLVGLGFAETTPGPLISVVQFVAFMAAFRASGALDPVLAGTLGGFLAMWSTFVPSFLWIFLGGPYVERLLSNRTLSAALSAITAAVVGVVLNLAVWLALHTLFAEVEVIRSYGLQLNVPRFASIEWAALAIGLGAAVAIFRFRAGMLPVLAASCLAGIVAYLAF